MTQPHYQTLLSAPLAFWAASVDEHGCPVLIRVNGVDATHFPELTFFIPAVFATQFMQTLQEGKAITLLGTHIPTYNSYQYKGFFRAIRLCTEDEVRLQLAYIDQITDIVDELLGLSKQKVFDSIFFQPSHAVQFTVTEVFNQTPGKGAGNPEIVKPLSHHD